MEVCQFCGDFVSEKRGTLTQIHSSIRRDVRLRSILVCLLNIKFFVCLQVSAQVSRV